jgi:regulator of protease activity HflC (stomatin/prohibitin superfamily)
METFYRSYQNLDNFGSRVISPRVNENFKNVFGQFNAVTAVQERTRLNQQVEDAIREAVESEGVAKISSVQIENIDFSESYERSIEARMEAEVEVQKLRQNAERTKVEAEITVTKAKAEADAVRASALANAEAIKLRGDAEALVIKSRGDALRANPSLILLTQAEKWNGVLPTTMVPNGTVPFLNMKGDGGTVLEGK